MTLRFVSVLVATFIVALVILSLVAWVTGAGGGSCGFTGSNWAVGVTITVAMAELVLLLPVSGFVTRWLVRRGDRPGNGAAS